MDTVMKRGLSSFVLILLAAGALAMGASAQSLGEIAREQRAKKPAPSPAAKVYTNDSISSGASASASTESQPASSSTASSASSATSAGTSGASSSSASSAEDRAKAEQEWKQKFAEQRKTVAQLERELDVLKRENKLRAAAFYADAGTRLRDEKKYAEDDRRYKAETEAKEQELAAAKQKFTDMQDEARKAGMPSRVSDE
jgi:hypothetical protein